MGRLCQSFEVYDIIIIVSFGLAHCWVLTDIKPLFTPQLLEAGANSSYPQPCFSIGFQDFYLYSEF